jgi:hypothetical protein
MEVPAHENPAAAIWRSAQDALIAGDAATLERLLRENQGLFRDGRPPCYGSGSLAPDYSAGDTQSILVKNHHFENWAAFASYKEALASNRSPVAQFEAAVDAIVAGDTSTLDRLLRENPELIHGRSTRTHHATLLHYVGANGVEAFRQKTPPNIVAVARLLLDAGAPVDALAGMYGGSTVLGLAATSIHPADAGVLAPLIALLLEYGAVVDQSSESSIVNSCLANGRAQGAELMVAHGARLDLEGAAGVGRLDLIKTFFDQQGVPKTEAIWAQRNRAFAWACEFGRTAVVDFLLQRGFPIDAQVPHHGQTGLHWAACNAHVDTVQLLLERHAPVNAEDETWKNTPLGWALDSWREQPSTHHDKRYYEVAALLVASGAQVRPEWLSDPYIRAEPRMLAALGA